MRGPHSRDGGRCEGRVTGGIGNAHAKGLGWGKVRASVMNVIERERMETLTQSFAVQSERPILKLI